MPLVAMLREFRYLLDTKRRGAPRGLTKPGAGIPARGFLCSDATSLSGSQSRYRCHDRYLNHRRWPNRLRNHYLRLDPRRGLGTSDVGS